MTLPLVVAVPKCPKTDKRCFESEAAATDFETKNREQYGNPRQFPYACEDCPAWHLTTTPPGNNSIAQNKYDASSVGTRAPGAPGRKGIETQKVVQLKESGMTLRQIADELKITAAAVKYHLDKAEGKIPTASQLVTYEQHRDKRIELEAELARKKKQHQEAEALAQAEITRIKAIENRLFEQRQLQIGYAPGGTVILSKNNHQFSLTPEEIKKVVAEVNLPAQPTEADAAFAVKK